MKPDKRSSTMQNAAMSEASVSSRSTTKVKVATRRRVGRAWREIRRGAAASRIKDLFYGMGPDGIDMALADALSVLVQNGPMRMGELAEALHITPATATRAVDCLVDKGLAERVKAVDDLRSILVSVTEAGGARHAVISARIGTGLDQMLVRSARKNRPSSPIYWNASSSPLTTTSTTRTTAPNRR